MITGRGDMKTDQEQLNKASQSYYYTEKMSTDNRLRSLLIKRCLPFTAGPKVLELGFMDGQWTDQFLGRGYSVDIVEGASRQCDEAKARYGENKSVRVYHSLFEDYAPDCRYDTILAGGMIKHLPEPQLFLKKMRDWLNDDGVLVATTPNGASLHRRVGAYMGVLGEPEELTATDKDVANLRVYNRYTFRNELLRAGWKVHQLGGAALKPVSTDLMTEWSDKLLEALDCVADELQDYSWYIYAICKK
jgi:2-polyprenyl-3-methyl-5-hydroxy-6-metoxy-1,4-benzoquinol methylase